MEEAHLGEQRRADGWQFRSHVPSSPATSRAALITAVSRCRKSRTLGVLSSIRTQPAGAILQSQSELRLEGWMHKNV
jgi:hypothetical protein